MNYEHLINGIIFYLGEDYIKPKNQTLRELVTEIFDYLDKIGAIRAKHLIGNKKLSIEINKIIYPKTVSKTASFTYKNYVLIGSILYELGLINSENKGNLKFVEKKYLYNRVNKYFNNK